MTLDFEEQYFNVLRAIEVAVLTSANDATTDRHVRKALEALARYYGAAIKGRTPQTLRLNGPEKDLFDALKAAVEPYLRGEGLVYNEQAAATITIDEAVLCLRRILRSVGHMGGGTGYLDFLREFHSRSG